MRTKQRQKETKRGGEGANQPHTQRERERERERDRQRETERAAATHAHTHCLCNDTINMGRQGVYWDLDALDIWLRKYVCTQLNKKLFADDEG